MGREEYMGKNVIEEYIGMNWDRGTMQRSS